MKVRDHYDWIVLGTHPGALVSASLAAQLGLSVLVLPFGLSLPSKRFGKGQVFDPESNLVLGLSEENLAPGLIFQCLGLSEMDPKFKTSLRAGNGVRPQVLTPQTRFVFQSNDLIQWEIQREFGNQVGTQLGLQNALKSYESDLSFYWRELPKRLVLKGPPLPGTQPDSYSFHRDLADVRKNLLLKQKAKKKQNSKKFFQPSLFGVKKSSVRSRAAQVTWLSGVETAAQLAKRLGIEEFGYLAEGVFSGLTSTQGMDPSLFDLLLVLSLSRTGSSFPGGMGAYREFLLQRAVQLGVHYSPQAQCKRVFIEDHRFLGVQIAGAGNMIAGEKGILGCSLSRIDPYLSQPGGSWVLPGSRKSRTRSHPVGWKFTLALSVHREAIPEKMQSHLFWQEKDSPYLEVEVVEGVDYGSTQNENQTLFLRTILPFELETLDHLYQRRIAGRMFRQATEIMPFLEFHVTQVYPDFRSNSPAVRSLLRSPDEVSDPNQDLIEDELTRLYGFASLDAIPDSLLCYSGRGLGPRTAVDRLYLASDESYPFLGGLGGVIAAIQAVSDAAGRSSLRID